MKTKTNILLLLLLSIVLLGTSCTQDMEYKDVELTAVKQLYAPKDNYSLQLLSSATASQYFEWATSKVEDGGSPLYEVVFDKKDGDFSNPIYRLTSDDMGTQNYATISHKVLDKIASLAGLGSGETGTLKWTVVSSRGLSEMTAEQSRTITITRLLGFADIPAQVYITGEGSEGGTDASKALAFSSPANGEFEIFTKLEAGKEYHFVSTKDASPRLFYSDGTSLKESSTGTGSATVDETGVYRINLDFNIATATITKIKSIGFYFCPEDEVTIDFSYQGNGIWQGTGRVDFYQWDWGKDQRYKFEMVSEKSGVESVTHWGPTNASLDNAPSDSEAASYYYMQEWPESQWDNKWKLQDKFDGQNVTFTIYLNASGHYTHSIKLATD